MYLLKFAVLLMAAVATGSAGSLFSSCDSSNLMICLAPSLMFILSPDYQQLATIRDGTEITESQLVGVCKMGRTTLGCIKDMAECVLPMTEMADTFEILVGAAKLLEVCDRPDFYSKYQIMAQCTKNINQTSSKTRGCYNAAMREVMSDFKQKDAGLSRLESGLAMLQRRDLLQHMCCTIKFYETCIGTEIADKCGQEAQEITNDVNSAIKETFQCNGPRGDNCPVLPPPTAEDEANSFDFTRLFTAGMGGFGGMGSLGGSSSLFQG